MQNKNLQKSGYSLIEILLYMGLLSIFLFSLTNLFTSSLDVRLESEAKSSLDQDGRYLISRFRYDITQSSSIALPANVGSSGNTLQVSRASTNYTYSLSGTNLVVSNGTTTFQLNSDRTEVSNLTFTRRGVVGGKNSITVSYDLTSKIVRSSGTQTRNYTYTYDIR